MGFLRSRCTARPCADRDVSVPSLSRGRLPDRRLEIAFIENAVANMSKEEHDIGVLRLAMLERFRTRVPV